MPTSKRKSSGPAVRGAQSTLSFGSRSKVTKPGTGSAAATKAKILDDAEDIPHRLEEDVSANEVTTEVEPAELEPEEEPEIEEAAKEVRLEPKPEPAAAVSEAEITAKRVGEKEIKAYWRAREAERKTPRVHQQDLSLYEKILRHFDLSSQYGPCVGITRINRWKRANTLNMHPPIEVLAVLLKEMDNAKNGTPSKLQRAHIDELLGGRIAEVAD